MTGIVRQPHQWDVGLTRNGIFHRKVFLISKTRDENAALALAQAWRDSVMADHPEIPRWRSIELACSGGNPGGVTAQRGPDGKALRWLAQTILGEGWVMREAFDVALHGKSAWSLAVKAREQQLRLMVAQYAEQQARDAQSSRLPNGQRDARMYGLTEQSTYWLVKIQRNKQFFTQSFSFIPCGGREKALAMARAWRDDIVARHPPIERQKRANQSRRNNKTGIPGVSCILWPDGSPRQWTAHTYIGPGQRLQKAFSVYRYGDDARCLAIAERERQLAQMQGLARLHPAEERVRGARKADGNKAS